MSKEDLRAMTESEIIGFIRIRKKGAKFDMSGYEEETGRCTVENTAILNLFAYLGIYNYTHYLFLDFYKGVGTIYLRYWGDDKNHALEVAGYGTSEIIYEVMKLTILTDNETRRRW